jgi:parallel beta-helix repeat protein
LIGNNEITDHAKSGILINEGDLDVTITNNTIVGNGDNGINLKQVKKVTIQHNKIRGNVMSGIDICACNTVVKENIITNNETGLYLFSDCVASIVNNKLHDNKQNGLEMRPNVLLNALDGNEITNNGSIGKEEFALSSSQFKKITFTSTGAFLCCLKSKPLPLLNPLEINTKNKIIYNSKENLVIEFKEDLHSSTNDQRPTWACQYTRPSIFLLFEKTT